MHLNESKENEQQQIVQQQAIQRKESNQNTSFKDNRPEAIYQRKMQDMANNSSRVMQLQAMQEMANKGYQSRSIFQRKESNNDNLNFPIQRKENKTGLPDNLKSGIENLSGHSMDDVKVHYNSDKPAQLQAHAYAQGTDIHLGAGQEKHLPHEAWHVVQQKQGRVKPTMQMKGKVNVNDDSGLEREADVMGAKALQMKHNGNIGLRENKINNQEKIVQRFWYGDVKNTELLAVRSTPKLTDENTIADLPTVTPVSVIDDTNAWFIIEVDTKSKDIVLNSISKSHIKDGILTGYVDGGYIEKVTSLAATHRDIEGKNGADILKETTKPTKKELEGVMSQMSTEVKINTKTGKLPTFNKKITDENSEYFGQDYEKKLTQITERNILWQYQKLGKDKADLRKDSKNLHNPKDIDNLGGTSKEETDKVFGGIKKGPALKFGVNIFDGWEKKEKELKAKPHLSDKWIDWRVRKIIQGPSLSKLNKIHGAVQSRKEEEQIIIRVKATLKKKYEYELLQTHLGWGGFASEGNIYLQRYKSDDNNKNRQYMWNYFETIIHEYIHTLEHEESKKYSHGLSDKAGGKVLREGFTDYFTNIVWSDINFSDEDFRKKVEGPFYNENIKGTPKTARKGYYDEANNAEKIAKIIGYNNLIASYFLGKTELIRG